ncbi:putative protein of unknown function (DUF3602) [Lyophyllum shimeji]|uniref:Uncharacterized protein n=1 Tax=Lyophyllum shimeji TaxID=47721 RepID=A0A9P3UPB1_LYOSH|nr:putative protein of unknown function (DUF3602) [Lyophyllum shimeji]
MHDRSRSRGREVYQSSGRGGAGNIRQASVSREARPQRGPEDVSISRGREPLPAMTQSFSTGRGGAGNIRSPSRDQFDGMVYSAPQAPIERTMTIAEEEFIREHVAASQDIPFSSGRGGAGNIQHTRSRSRSRSRGPPIVPPISPSIAAPPQALIIYAPGMRGSFRNRSHAQKHPYQGSKSPPEPHQNRPGTALQTLSEACRKPYYLLKNLMRQGENTYERRIHSSSRQGIAVGAS